MRRMGNLPFQKSCFAHIALLGFQRADGLEPSFVSLSLKYTLIPFLQGNARIFLKKLSNVVYVRLA